MIFDGLRNLVANLGTSRDKASAATYHFAALSQQELRSAYRTSWLAQQIINVPANDMVREWRVWQGEADQISALEAEEARLDLVGNVRQAMTLARLYGGAGIYIGTGETDLTQPINTDRARVEFLAVIPRGRLSAAELQNDPRLPGYGKPKAYMTDGAELVHPSRLVILHGASLPDQDMSGDGWGDSVLQSTLDAVKGYDSLVANILSLTYEAKVDVVKIPGLMTNLAKGGSDYENQVLSRWRLAMTGKGINGALMIDAEEEYEQKQITFGGLHELWDRFMIAVSGAADIPVTRLFGRAPAGLNATGESDTRNYYDMIRSIQAGNLQPAMAVLDELLIRSALGSRPEEVFYEWRSLMQPTAKDRAEVADKLASAFEKVHRMDVVPEDALGAAVVNALTEGGVAPGLEADVAEYFDTEPPGETGEEV